MSKNLIIQQLAGIRREAGNGFIAALDDIRQKVIEEGWSGRTATTAHDLKVELSDPMAALYGRKEGSGVETPAEIAQTTTAYNQAYNAGAMRTVREIESSVTPGTLEWLRGPGADAGSDPLGRTASKAPPQQEAAPQRVAQQEQDVAEL